MGGHLILMLRFSADDDVRHRGLCVLHKERNTDDGFLSSVFRSHRLCVCCMLVVSRVMSVFNVHPRIFHFVQFAVVLLTIIVTDKWPCSKYRNQARERTTGIENRLSRIVFV